MLIQFSVGNYKSIGETVTLSMVAAKIRSKDGRLDEDNVFEVSEKLELLKSAAIYGANASGKSNLVAAIAFMRRFVLVSSKETQAEERIDVEGFRLSTVTEGKPSSFEMVFLLDGVKYRYGFEVSPQRVVSEWLFHTPAGREAVLFTREAENIVVSRAFKEGKGFENRTRNNALFLSVVAQFNGPIAQRVLTWFRNLGVISGLEDTIYRTYMEGQFESSQYREDIVLFVKRLDVGIDGLQAEKIDPAMTIPRDAPEKMKELLEGLKDLLLRTGGGTERTVVRTFHRKFDASGQHVSQEIFDLDSHESEGTKKLFALAGLIIDTLRTGKVVVIDEFDARLHPLISREIVALFNSKESNPHNAQLVFTTHDTNLLSNRIFRRDQVWFTEKDQQGATYLYSLAEYKVRNDASYESDYIRGRYGAIPFIGDLRRLPGQPNA